MHLLYHAQMEKNSPDSSGLLAYQKNLNCLKRKKSSNPQWRRVRREERIFSQMRLRIKEKIASLQILRPESEGFQ